MERPEILAQSLDFAATVDELLNGSPWRVMHFVGALFDPKPPAEFTVKRIGVVTHYIESATFRWTFRSERAHNHVAAGAHGIEHRPNILSSLLRIDQEVKNRAIMPHIESL
jgi:hypothetical protein